LVRSCPAHRRHHGPPVRSCTPPPTAGRFAGTSHARLTTANSGDYFDNGSILHLAHTIEDLAQFYAKAANAVDPGGPEPFTERVQYVFRSDPIPSTGNNN
jgi:hypothetical protein